MKAIARPRAATAVRRQQTTWLARHAVGRRPAARCCALLHLHLQHLLLHRSEGAELGGHRAHLAREGRHLFAQDSHCPVVTRRAEEWVAASARKSAPLGGVRAVGARSARHLSAATAAAAAVAAAAHTHPFEDADDQARS